MNDKEGSIGVNSSNMLGIDDPGSLVNLWYDSILGGNPMTRTRYMELMKIAKELCDWLEKKGVKSDEGCKVRKLTEQLWEMKK